MLNCSDFLDTSLAQSADPGHSEWSYRKQCERLGSELNSLKRMNAYLKKHYDKAIRDSQYAQQQVSMLKADRDNLQVQVDILQ